MYSQDSLYYFYSVYFRIACNMQTSHISAGQETRQVRQSLGLSIEPMVECHWCGLVCRKRATVRSRQICKISFSSWDLSGPIRAASRVIRASRNGSALRFVAWLWTITTWKVLEENWCDFSLGHRNYYYIKFGFLYTSNCLSRHISQNTQRGCSTHVSSTLLILHTEQSQG